MFKRLLKKYTLFTLLTFFHVVGLNAQTQTHAEATSQKWKGIDVNTVIGNSAYPDNNTMTSGYPFLLFNVGTGRFVVQGGDWAMEGRLFYTDFGRTMYLYNNGRINSGLTEAGVSTTKNCFCCRPPLPFGRSWSNYNTINLTTLLDGEKQTNKNGGNFNMQWQFDRVEDPSNTDTYTYYMHLVHTRTNPVNYYLGAAWGEWHVPNGKGDGLFVYLDGDRSCWTTVNVTDENAIKAVPLWDTTTENGVYLKQENGKAMLESGDEVEIQKLYQWRLISLEEFIAVLNDDGMGLNPSISSLIPDRDFTRNSDDFFDGNDAYDHWIVSPLSDDYTYAKNTYRYTYTSTDYRKGQSQHFNNNQRSINSRVVELDTWDSPVKSKVVFDRAINTAAANDGNSVRDSQQEGMKNAKFGFMPFEGVGTISTNFEAPKPGWYEIECVGFSMSSEDHDAYLFARVIPNSRANDLENTFEVPSTDQPHYGKVTLQKLPFGTYSKNSYPACLEVGKELLYNGDAHKQKVWVLISQEDWDNNLRTIRVGIGKDQATQSDLMKTYKGKNAYYDTDWVCVDDIRALYMGLSPVFFYEDEEDLRYLSQADADADRFTPNEYAVAVKSGRYGGAANLQRKFTKDEWNTFSFPLPLTGEQVRNAFGDDCELLILHSVGNLSNNDCIIDFQTVDLLTTDNVVTAGNLYMLKPTKEPAFGENPRGEMAYYYDLGKMFFSTNGENEDPQYTFPVMDLNVWKGEQPVGSFENKNDGCGYVTYIQTPNFDAFRVDRNGTKLTSVDSPDDSYAPKGSYAMSGGKMYELSRDTRIKGFRGWVMLTHSIFEDEASMAAGAKIAINGVIDGEAPSAIDRHTIVPVNPNSITAVYDLSGRKVDTSVGNLPKGIYIVNGKKLLMK